MNLEIDSFNMSNDNKPVVLITGANTGIGLEIVKALCASDKPYSIILSGRTLEKIQQAVKEVKEAFPKTASSLSEVLIDVESDESIEKAFEKISAEHDRIDALINNAGSAIHRLGLFRVTEIL